MTYRPKNDDIIQACKGVVVRLNDRCNWSPNGNPGSGDGRPCYLIWLKVAPMYLCPGRRACASAYLEKKQDFTRTSVKVDKRAWI